MSKQKIDAALKQAADSGDVAEAWREAFGDQITADQFRTWHRALREIPDDMVLEMVDARKGTTAQAFTACCPNHVSLEEFKQLAAAYVPAKPSLAPVKETKATKTK